MNTQSHFQDAVIDIKPVVNTPLLDSLSARVVRLLGESLSGLKKNKNAVEQLSSLTDEHLLAEVVTMLSAKRAMVSEREIRKQNKRLKARLDFFAMLDKFGGLYKAGDVTKKLGVSRQTVTNQRKSNKLLSVKSGNDYHFPAFQFTEQGKLPHFEIILDKLAITSPITQCSFFINSIEMTIGDKTERLSPLALLQRGPNDIELAALVREAVLFGQPVAL